MCFFSRLTLSVSELKRHYQAEPLEMDDFEPTERFNGFAHPLTPVITNDKPDKIRLFGWGLMPAWASDESFRKNTLNARLETLYEKPSFKPYVANRCLVLANGFYEWQWLDPKGKQKQGYLITLPDEQPFAFAGLWNVWKQPGTGLLVPTYTIITRPADELMATIHNTKQRMPYILKPGDEKAWLEGAPPMEPAEMLVATPVNGPSSLG
jgi:putative SOS response-associated peptidase YedK